MLIEQLKQRVDWGFSRVLDQYSSVLPFKGMVVRAVRDLFLAYLSGLKPHLEAVFAKGGSFEAAADFLRTFAKGNVRVPWYVRLVVNPNKVIDQLYEFVIANRATLQAGVGDLPPG